MPTTPGESQSGPSKHLLEQNLILLFHWLKSFPEFLTACWIKSKLLLPTGPTFYHPPPHCSDPVTRHRPQNVGSSDGSHWLSPPAYSFWNAISCLSSPSNLLILHYSTQTSSRELPGLGWAGLCTSPTALEHLSQHQFVYSLVCLHHKAARPTGARTVF